MRNLMVLVMAMACVGCSHGWRTIKEDFYMIDPDKTYKMHAMTIYSVDCAGTEMCTAEFCYKGKCWDLFYEGDLSDFENGDLVNVKFKGTEIISIGRPWPTTRLCYSICGNYFLSKWVGNIALVAWILYFFPAMFPDAWREIQSLFDEVETQEKEPTASS